MADNSRVGKLIIPKDEKSDGCEPFSVKDDFDQQQMFSNKKDVPAGGYFLLLQRGSCNFATKIENAMKTGLF